MNVRQRMNLYILPRQQRFLLLLLLLLLFFQLEWHNWKLNPDIDLNAALRIATWTKGVGASPSFTSVGGIIRIGLCVSRSRVRGRLHMLAAELAFNATIKTMTNINIQQMQLRICDTGNNATSADAALNSMLLNTRITTLVAADEPDSGASSTNASSSGGTDISLASVVASRALSTGLSVIISADESVPPVNSSSSSSGASRSPTVSAGSEKAVQLLFRMAPSQYQRARVFFDILDFVQQSVFAGGSSAADVRIAVMTSSDVRGVQTGIALERAAALFGLQISVILTIPNILLPTTLQPLQTLITTLNDDPPARAVFVIVALPASLASRVVTAAHSLGLLTHPSLLWLAHEEFVAGVEGSNLTSLADGLLYFRSAEGTFNRSTTAYIGWNNAFERIRSGDLSTLMDGQAAPSLALDGSVPDMDVRLLFTYDAIATAMHQIDIFLASSYALPIINGDVVIDPSAFAVTLGATSYVGTSGSVSFFGSGERKLLRWEIMQLSLAATSKLLAAATPPPDFDPRSLYGLRTGCAWVGQVVTNLGVRFGGPQPLQLTGTAAGWSSLLTTDMLAQFGPFRTTRIVPERRVWFPTTTVSVPPSGRYGGCVVRDSQAIYIFGGSAQAKGDPFSDAWQFNLVTQQWRRWAVLGNQPAPRFFGGCLLDASAEWIYLYGGISNEGMKGDTWKFNLASQQWLQVDTPQDILALIANTAFGVGVNTDASQLAVGDQSALQTVGVPITNNLLAWGGQHVPPPRLAVYQFNLDDDSWTITYPAWNNTPLHQPDMPPFDQFMASLGSDLNQFNSLPVDGTTLLNYYNTGPGCSTVRTFIGGRDSILLGSCGGYSYQFRNNYTYAIYDVATDTVYPFYLRSSVGNSTAVPLGCYGQSYGGYSVIAYPNGDRKAFISHGFNELCYFSLSLITSLDLTCPGPRCGIRETVAIWGEPTETPNLLAQGHELIHIGGWGMIMHNQMLLVNTRGLNFTTAIGEDYVSPSARAYHSAVVIGNTQIVFGGLDGSGSRNDLWTREMVEAGSNSQSWIPLVSLNAPPAPRHGHVAVASRMRMWVHGGTDGTLFFDDLWTYDPQANKWAEVQVAVSTSGKTGGSPVFPPARAFHSAVEYTEGVMVIYAGLSAGQLVLQDIWSFAVANLSWTWLIDGGDNKLLPAPVQIITPAQQAAAFQRQFNGTSTSLTNSFSTSVNTTGSSSSSSGSDSGLNNVLISTALFPPARAYACFVKDGLDLYIIAGVGAADTQLTDLWQINLAANFTFNLLQSYTYNRASAMCVNTPGHTILWYGGFDYEKVRPGMYEYDILSNNVYAVDESMSFSNSLPLGGASIVSFGNSVHIFGGTSSQLGSIVSCVEFFTNTELLFTFGEDECSPGTIPERSRCTSCPVGTFWTTDPDSNPTCKECLPGFSSGEVGAASFATCLPCPEGTWALASGQQQCDPCTSQQRCPIGSMYPQERRTTTTSAASSSDASSSFSVSSTQQQPSPYKDAADSVASMDESLGIAFGVTIAAFVISYIALVWYSRQSFLKPFDRAFQDQHETRNDFPTFQRQTNQGGMCTLVLAVLFLYVILSLSFQFFLNNNQEIRALVPTVSVDSQIFTATMNLSVAIHDYRARCLHNDVDITTNGGRCADGIRLTRQTGVISAPDDLSSQLQCMQVSRSPPPPALSFLDAIGLSPSAESELTQVLQLNDCHVSWTCSSCSIFDDPTSFLFEFTESNTYAPSLEWRISSDSGLPNQASVLSGSVVAPDHLFLRGTASPTVAVLAATQTGYHASASTSLTGYFLQLVTQTIGSSTGAAEFQQSNGIAFSFQLQRTQTSLSITLTAKQTALQFVGSILGTVSGLIGALAIVLRLGEKAEGRWLSHHGRRHETSSGKLEHLFRTFFAHMNQQNGKNDEQHEGKQKQINKTDAHSSSQSPQNAASPSASTPKSTSTPAVHLKSIELQPVPGVNRAAPAPTIKPIPQSNTATPNRATAVRTNRIASSPPPRLTSPVVAPIRFVTLHALPSSTPHTPARSDGSLAATPTSLSTPAPFPFQPAASDHDDVELPPPIPSYDLTALRASASPSMVVHSHQL